MKNQHMISEEQLTEEKLNIALEPLFKGVNKIENEIAIEYYK
jgi:hypothetical protein